MSEENKVEATEENNSKKTDKNNKSRLEKSLLLKANLKNVSLPSIELQRLLRVVVGFPFLR